MKFLMEGFFFFLMRSWTLFHEKHRLKKRSVIQPLQNWYSYEKTEMLFIIKTDIVTRLAIVFISGKKKKEFVTVISKQN